MSHTEYKSGFRVPIESLRGKSSDEALEYFKILLGEPKEVDIWDGKVEYFRYDGKYQPDQEYTYRRDGKNDDGWFVDYIVDINNVECKFYIRINDIKKTVKELSEKFSVKEDEIMIFSYSWYNGSDEPRFIRPPNES